MSDLGVGLGEASRDSWNHHQLSHQRSENESAEEDSNQGNVLCGHKMIMTLWASAVNAPMALPHIGNHTSFKHS